MKINLGKINIINSIYLVFTVFFSVLIIYFSIFLYSHLYLGLLNVGVIYELQNQVSLDTINIKLFNEVEQKIDAKKNKEIPDFNSLNNPFN